MPSRRQQVLELQHGDGFAVRQQQLALGGAVGGVEQVGHDREQAADALGGQLQQPAVLEAGDQLAVHDLRRVHAAALEQPGEDRHQGDAGAIDLDAEVQREAPAFGVADADVVVADRLDRAGAEILVDLVAPAQRLQRRNPLGDEGLPALRGVAPPIDMDHAAFGGGAPGDAHLVEAVLAQHGEGRGFALRVAPDEAGGGGALTLSLDADELPLVVGGHEHAVVVEVDRQRVDALHPAEIVGSLHGPQPQDWGERAFEDDGLRLRGDGRGPAGRRMRMAEMSLAAAGADWGIGLERAARSGRWGIGGGGAGG